MTNNLKTYCQQCGAGNVYTLEKPRFCQACGQAVGIASPNTSNTQPQQKGEKHFEPPIMDSLDFETTPMTNKAPTLGDIVSASDPTLPPPQRRVDETGPKVTPPTNEEIMAEFQKEAGTLRKK